MKKHARFLTLLLFSLLFAAGSIPAFAAVPEVSVSSAQGKIGDTVTVTVSMKNVVNFTSGDLNILYNPNILQLQKVTKSKAMTSDKEITIMYTDPEDPGQESHSDIGAFYLSVLHLNKFPQSLNACDLVSLEFKAVGGGECPLILSVSSFYMDETPSEPTIASGMVTIEGDAAESWDYGAHADSDILYTDASYADHLTGAVQPQPSASSSVAGSAAGSASDAGNLSAQASGMSTGAKIGIAAGAVAAVGIIVLIVVVAVKKKNEMIQ